MLLSVVGVRSMGRLMIFASIAWYLMLLVFANLQSFPAAIICLAATGFAQSLCMISIAVTLLRAAEERFRGRIMGVRMMMIYGLPIGLLAAGSLIERFGFAVTGSLYAVVGLTWFLAIVFRWRGEVWERGAPANGG
jgi:predicted MFS family arabinose efflux permease